MPGIAFDATAWLKIVSMLLRLGIGLSPCECVVPDRRTSSSCPVTRSATAYSRIACVSTPAWIDHAIGPVHHRARDREEAQHDEAFATAVSRRSRREPVAPAGAEGPQAPESGRSGERRSAGHGRRCGNSRRRRTAGGHRSRGDHRRRAAPQVLAHGLPAQLADRKSTRLNSSHLVISYAVFCLKKKN